MKPLVISLSARPFDRPHRWLPGERFWVAAVALLLLTTAALKWQALATSPPVTARERVFDLPMNDWWLLAGLAEGFVVLMLAAAPSATAALQTIRLAFLTVAGYRLLLFLHGGGDCGCLGAVSGSGLLQDQEGWILTSIAVGVLGINELLLALRFARSRKPCGTPTPATPALLPSPSTSSTQGGFHG
jgi:hypothetical protein